MKNKLEKKIFLSPPHLNGEEINYIQEAIKSNWIAPLGPHVDNFEKEIASYIGVKHAAAMSSGTAALHLALKVIGIKKGDFIFCSDLTFVATVNAIKYLDAIPIFIDCEGTAWNMCPEALVKGFKSYKPKAVIVTDLYGQSADYEAITKICNKFKTPIIEDAAESLGAEFKGKKCGSFGDLSILSFNGNKIITTGGGGMLLSNNESYIKKARKLSTQAREEELHYEHLEIGYNYRMSNILAGIGRAQLKTLDKYVEKRREIFKYYYKNLYEINDVNFINEPKNGKSSYWLTIIIFKNWNHPLIEELINVFAEHNIEARPVWKPMHQQPVFKEEKLITKERASVASKFFEYGLCLPSGTNLSKLDQDRVIKILINQINNNKTSLKR